MNDVTRNVSESRWLQNQHELRTLARTQLGVRLFIISSPPPMEGFHPGPQIYATWGQMAADTIRQAWQSPGTGQ